MRRAEGTEPSGLSRMRFLPVRDIPMGLAQSDKTSMCFTGFDQMGAGRAAG